MTNPSLLNIVVVYGGKSSEREVSLRSGNAVIKALKILGHHVTATDGVESLKTLKLDEYDLVFNILHGEAGENGELAGFLSTYDIKYTGCDIKGAVLSWHKDVAKALVSQTGVLTPISQTIQNINDLKTPETGKWIIKPTQEGSSVGLYLVESLKDLKSTAVKALKDVDSVLIEQYIEGQECTVAIIDNEALPVVRIEPINGLYDYDAKYESQETGYFCPSGFSKALETQLKQYALKAFKALDLKGWARIDFIVDKNNDCWFLEANTTPGMTETSLVPKAANAKGWSFDELVSKIIETAFPGVNDV